MGMGWDVLPGGQAQKGGWGGRGQVARRADAATARTMPGNVVASPSRSTYPLGVGLWTVACI